MVKTGELQRHRLQEFKMRLRLKDLIRSILKHFLQHKLLHISGPTLTMYSLIYRLVLFVALLVYSLLYRLILFVALTEYSIIYGLILFVAHMVGGVFFTL
jgi:hypothetical protein